MGYTPVRGSRQEWLTLERAREYIYPPPPTTIPNPHPTSLTSTESLEPTNQTEAEMKFTAASVIAALVAVVSSAAIERRGSPLPARFSLEIVSDSPDANGLRVRYEGGKSPSPVLRHRDIHTDARHR